MKCSFCNGENPEASVTCVHCGRSLYPVPGAQPEPVAAAAPGDGAAPAIIPYKNLPALISYYLGVFSAIPCAGIPLGLTAFVLGILGLKRAKAHPEAKGKVHAWVGIIVGGLFGFGYLVALFILAVMGASSRWR